MNGFDQTSDSTRPPWKIVVLVAGAAVIAVALIVGAVLFVRSRQKVEIASQNMDRIEAQLASSLAGCAQEPDPEECRNQKVLLAAKATGASTVCEQLTGSDHDSCVWTVAKDREDPESCAAIADVERAKTCSDQINVRLALSKKDASFCDKVLDAAKQDGCRNSVDGPLTEANCVGRGSDQAVCDKLAQFEAAVAAKDPSKCLELSDETEQSRCADLVGTGDVDLDGLMADEERSYGSSDTNPDTDGDGYSDFAEVKAGYNPAGPGKLGS